MTRFPPIEAVIFDLDGTLVDSLEDIAGAANAVLEANGHRRHPVDAYRRFVGGGTRSLFARALEAEGASVDDGHLDALAAEMLRRYGASLLVHTRPYPGVPALLTAMGEARIAGAVLSNKAAPLTARIVDALFPSVTFAAVSGASPGSPHKPDPTGALALARRLRVAPSKVAFVGDSDVDVFTAQNAGMIAVGAAWGFRGHDELVDAGAAFVADDADALRRTLFGE